jgi:hypothetical protein
VSGETRAWSGTELRSGAEPEVPEERGKCLVYLCESVVWSGDEKRKLQFFYRSVQWIGPDVCERRGERVVWNGAEVWSGAEKNEVNFSYRSVQWIGPDICERRGERVVWNGAEVWSGAGGAGGARQGAGVGEGHKLCRVGGPRRDDRGPAAHPPVKEKILCSHFLKGESREMVFFVFFKVNQIKSALFEQVLIVYYLKCWTIFMYKVWLVLPKN